MKKIEDIKFKLCKYKIETCIIYIPGEKPYELDIDKQFLLMTLEHDYNNFLYPFFEMTVSVPNSIYRKMKKNSDKLHLQILMKYAFFDKDVIADSVKTVKKYEFINDKFYIFMEDDSTEVIDILQKTVEENTNYNERQGTNANNETTVRLLLYKEDVLTEPKELLPKVFTGCSLTDAVTYVLNHIGTNKVLMSPAANNKKYNELILPPVRRIESLERLCNDYALHENGTIIFFDFKRTYILDKGIRCTAWEPGEKKLNYVVCQPMVTADRSISGVYIDNEENVNYLTMKITRNSAKSLKAEQLYGSKVRVLNNKTGSVTYYQISDDEIKRVDNMKNINATRTIIVNTGEEDTINALLLRIKEQSLSWAVNLDNTLVSLLAPNKDYNFIFTDTSQTKYNGYYRIGNFTTTFTKSDGGWITAQTLASFFGTKE